MGAYGPTPAAGNGPSYTHECTPNRVSHSARQKLNFLRTNHDGQTTGPVFLFFHVYSFPTHLDPFPFPDFGSSPKPVSLNISRCSSPHSRMRPILQVVTPPRPIAPQCWWPSSPWGWGSPGTALVGSGCLGSEWDIGVSQMLWCLCAPSGLEERTLSCNLTKYTILMSWDTAEESRNLTGKVQICAQ